MYVIHKLYIEWFDCYMIFELVNFFRFLLGVKIDKEF